MSSHSRLEDLQAPRIGLPRRSFRFCLVALGGLSALNCVLIAVLLKQAAYVDEALPPAVAALTWPVLVKDWVLSLLPIWLLARAVRAWVARRLEAPIESIVDRCDRFRHGHRTSVGTLRPKGSELSRAAAAVEDLLNHIGHLEHQQHRCLTDAAHELRTPLTAQAIVAENVLAKRSDPAALREAVGSMLEEARHMQRLIESLLLMRRAGAARPATAEEARLIQVHDLSELARSCANTLQVLAEEKQQTIGIRCPGPVWASVDPTMARQAMLNVVHNAIQHCQDGAHIDIETSPRAGGKALIAVSDNGPGIAYADQARVFESFFRGTGSSRPQGSGLGLGLAIARATMASQGGSIYLSSHPGRGCRFELMLPLAGARKPPVEVPEATAPRASPRRWHESGASDPAPIH